MHKFITPRVGSDVTLIILTLITTKFQSTLPVWGATAKMHKILFLISEEYVDSAKRQAVGLNIKGNLPFIPSAF